MIKETFGDECYRSSTNLNPADCGTRTDPGAEQVSTTSQFFNGPDWIPNGSTEAIEQQKIVHLSKFAKLPKNTEGNMDTDGNGYEAQEQGPNTEPKPYELPHQIEEYMTNIETNNSISSDTESDSKSPEEIISKESKEDKENGKLTLSHDESNEQHTRHQQRGSTKRGQESCVRSSRDTKES